MSSLLGLPSLIVTGHRETWARLSIHAEPTSAVCSKCGRSDELSDPKAHFPIVVADTPLRGKPAQIELSRFKYRCRRCARDFIGEASDIHHRRQMTHRLIRYIENNASRRPRQAIADEVGVSHDRIDRIAYELGERLAEHHRFPTPVILGIDDIRMNKQAYTIMTDAQTGYGVGFVDGATTDSMENFIKTHLVPPEIAVVVTDLAKANVALARRPGLTHILYVADQWHVLKGCRKAMSSIVARTLAKLDKAAALMETKGIPKKQNRPRKFAKQIRAKRRQLLGKRDYVLVADRTMIEDQELQDILNRFKRISRGFYARIWLARVFSADSEAEGRNRLAKFYNTAKGAMIAETMAPAVKTIREHEELILNAARARAHFPSVPLAAFTTSSTERRNGTLRGSWKAGRGVKNFAYLRLLALYQPWQLDVDIVECGHPNCSAIEGPVHLVPGLRGQDPDQPTLLRSAHLCRKHRAALSANVRAA